jgi:AcrR family transcriptional regulator
MSDDVNNEIKPPRRYDATRRRAQAAQTRAEILTAASDLFLEHGYAGTTLSAVAKAAGVVVETVYRAFGSKAGLLRAVVEAAVAGGADRAAVPAEERPAIQAVIAERDPRRQLALYARTQPGIHARQGPILRVLAQAAGADPELARVLEGLEEQRLGGLRRFAQLLADRGALRDGLSVDEARDLIWTLASPAVHDLLVIQRGWPPDRYRDWLAGALAGALLPG